MQFCCLFFLLLPLLYALLLLLFFGKLACLKIKLRFSSAAALLLLLALVSIPWLLRRSSVACFALQVFVYLLYVGLLRLLLAARRLRSSPRWYVPLRVMMVNFFLVVW
uniref:Uncharacterized protein n=1 Tax=Anopheles dirus TaxID=7168 RepID=A0A182NY73_9DIPT